MKEYMIMHKEDWYHFCSKINFGASCLDNKSIQFLNGNFFKYISKEEYDEIIKGGSENGN